MLLHLLHLVLDGGVQLVLELERLHVVHVAVAVEEVAVEDGARLLLGVPRCLGLVLVIPVTAVPASAIETREKLVRPESEDKLQYLLIRKFFL